MTTITIQLSGVADLRAAFERAAGKLAKPTELMAAIAAQMESNVQGRFDDSKAPDGSRWLRLAKSTQAAYRREEAKSGGKKQGMLLQRTGHMRASLSARGLDESAEIGFNRNVNGWPLAALHEFGTQRMPRRQLLTDDPVAGTLGQGDIADITDLVDQFLGDILA